MNQPTLKFVETTSIDLIKSPIDESLCINDLLGFDEDYEGAINGTLELIHSAPAFDHINAHELEATLGSGIHAVIAHRDWTIIATNGSYDPTEPVSSNNNPLTPGSKVHPQDILLEYRSYSEGQPAHFIFETPTGDTIEVSESHLPQFLKV